MKFLEIGLKLLMGLPIIAMANDTKLFLYQPFAHTNRHPDLIIHRTISGTCTKQSHLLKRENVWQCKGRDKIFDPCFTKRFGNNKYAICPESPWSSQAVKIQTQERFDNSAHVALDMSLTYPWAVELEDGVFCLRVFSPNTSPDPVVSYHCKDGSLLLSPLQRCTPAWKIIRKTAFEQVYIKIDKAWF